MPIRIVPQYPFRGVGQDIFLYPIDFINKYPGYDKSAVVPSVSPSLLYTWARYHRDLSCRYEARQPRAPSVVFETKFSRRWQRTDGPMGWKIECNLVGAKVKSLGRPLNLW